MIRRKGSTFQHVQVINGRETVLGRHKTRADAEAHSNLLNLALEKYQESQRKKGHMGGSK